MGLRPFLAVAVAALTVAPLALPHVAVPKPYTQAELSRPGSGVSVPFAEVSSVAFSTSTDGFALVITSAGTYVARTEDQGQALGASQ